MAGSPVDVKMRARFASPRHGDGSRHRRVRPDAARALSPDINLVQIDAAGGVLPPPAVGIYGSRTDA